MATKAIKMRFAGDKVEDFAVFLQPLMENEINFRVNCTQNGKVQKIGLTTSEPIGIKEGHVANWQSLSFSILFSIKAFQQNDVVAVTRNSDNISVKVNGHPACQFMFHTPKAAPLYLFVSTDSQPTACFQTISHSMVTASPLSPPQSPIICHQGRSCSLCLDAEASVMCLPCGHVTACTPCWEDYETNCRNKNKRHNGNSFHEKLPECVVCRAPVVRTTQVSLNTGVTNCVACDTDLQSDGVAVANPCGHAVACFSCVDQLNSRRKRGLVPLNCSSCGIVVRKFYKAHFA